MNTNNKTPQNPGRPTIPDDMLAWINELPETERTELEKTWHVTAVAEENKPDQDLVEEAWVNVQASTPEHRPAREKNRRIDRGALARRRRTIPVISVVSLVAVLIVVYVTFGSKTLVLETDGSSTLMDNLPDGTVVELNRNTRLTYHHGRFFRDRVAQLNGEAFFDVASGRRPFVVETFNARVRVLGTRLNIRAYTEEERAETQVSLETGAAEFFSKSAAEEKVILAPGQMSRLASDSHTPTAPSQIDYEGQLTWRDRGMFFSGASVDEIFEAIESRFDIEIEAGESIRQDSISLLLPQVNNAEMLLADICAYLGYRYRSRPGGFLVWDSNKDE